MLLWCDSDHCGDDGDAGFDGDDDNGDDANEDGNEDGVVKVIFTKKDANVWFFVPS